MEGEIDNEALELSRALCARAGMLLEDASAKVILVGDLDQAELRAAIQKIRGADALLAAAEALMAQ